MSEGNGQPLLRLTERSGDQPSRIVVSHSSADHRQRPWRMVIDYALALARRPGKIVRMSDPAATDDLLAYVPKRDKVVEGVLFLLERAEEVGLAMTADTMTKTMFLADKGHLDAFGRPIFFDNYIATTDGPVGVAAAEMLDPGFDLAASGDGTRPWDYGDAGETGRLRATRASNPRRLSRSDMEALTSALAMTASLDAAQLHAFTHRHPAYAAAWRDGAGAGTRMDPRLIPDERDDEMIDDLLYASRHAYVAPRRP